MLKKIALSKSFQFVKCHSIRKVLTKVKDYSVVVSGRGVSSIYPENSNSGIKSKSVSDTTYYEFSFWPGIDFQIHKLEPDRLPKLRILVLISCYRFTFFITLGVFQFSHSSCSISWNLI